MFHLLRLGTGSVFQMVFGALLVGFSIRGTISIRRDCHRNRIASAACITGISRSTHYCIDPDKNLNVNTDDANGIDQ